MTRDKPLTDRQLEVVLLIAQDKTTKEVASILGISPKTVENHRLSIYRRTGCRSLVGVTLWAIQQGFVRLPPV